MRQRWAFGLGALALILAVAAATTSPEEPGLVLLDELSTNTPGRSSTLTPNHQSARLAVVEAKTAAAKASSALHEAAEASATWHKLAAAAEQKWSEKHVATLTGHTSQEVLKALRSQAQAADRRVN